MQRLVEQEGIEPRELVSKLRDSLAQTSRAILSADVEVRVSQIIQEYDRLLSEFLDKENLGSVRGTNTFLSMSWLREATIRSINKANEAERRRETAQNARILQNAFIAIFSLETLASASLSAIPFANDARDIYELVTGYDLITGQRLNLFERSLAGMGMIAGSGKLYREVLNRVSARQVDRALKGSDELYDAAKTYFGQQKKDVARFAKAVDRSSEDGFRYVLYPRGRGASDLPAPADHVKVSRWAGDTEVRLWMDGGGTRIDPSIGRDAPKFFYTLRGDPRPGAAGRNRVDFELPAHLVSNRNNTGWRVIDQPVAANTPIYNVSIHLP